MVNKRRLLVIAAGIGVFAYLWQLAIRASTMNDLYAGIIFNANLNFDFIQYFLFAVATLGFMGVGETFGRNFGIYVLVRNRSTFKMFLQFLWKAIKYTTFFEFTKVLVFGVVLVITSGKFDFADVGSFFYLLVMNYLFLLNIVAFEMFIEILVDSKIAIYATQVFLLGSIFVADTINRLSNYQSFGVLILLNSTMNNRMELLKDSAASVYVLAPIVQIFFFSIMCLFCVFKFRRKDWI